MRRASLAAVACPIAQTLEVVGDPWTLLIVRDAFFGTRRFEDFRRSLGIPRATLTSRLHDLVRHGVMERRAYSDRPRRDEYVLTPKGRALGPLLVSMLQWGDEWSDLGDDSVELVDRESGMPIRAVYVDEHTRRPVAELRLTRRRRSGTVDVPDGAVRPGREDR